MFDIIQMLNETDADIDEFIAVLGMDKEKVLNIINSDDDENKERLYYQYVSNNLILRESLSFYKEFFNNECETEEFVKNVLSMEDNTPRCMINMVRRHVCLSDDIMGIRPGRDVLGLFNLVIAIEALYLLSSSKFKNKTDIMMDFFKNYISESDQKFINENTRFSYGDDIFKPIDIEQEVSEIDQEISEIDQEIKIDEFARLIYKLRCDYVHEGDFWYFSFNHSCDSWLMNDVCVKIPRISTDIENRTIETLMTFSDVRKIIVVGLINYIKNYMHI